MEESDWSVPGATVMDAARKMLDDGRSAVLATIVNVEGSAYRRPGAKMVVSPDGTGVGSITAGCLEEEVLALAREVLEAGEARIETYDLTGDDDVWGLGVGCNGVIDVLLEPLEESYRPAIEAFDAGDSLAVCTVLESDDPELAVGDRLFYDDGFPDGSPASLRETLAGPAARLAAAGRSRTATVDTGRGTVEVFVDGLSIPPDLVVLGTGHDVGPVVDLARKNDFRVTVIGFRGATATADRFPAADAVRSTSPARLTDAYDFDDRTYVVVMTHNFVDDRLALEELLGTPVPYVGLMGPRKRFEEMREEFAAEGRTFDSEELDRIYTPAGLDLGADTPYQIAHSIVAELLAVDNDRAGGHLAAQEGPIHDRVAPVEADADD